jgi:hypothetical protein
MDMPPKQPTIPAMTPTTWNMLPQGDERRVDFGNGFQTKIRLLQTNTPGFQKQNDLYRMTFFS